MHDVTISVWNRFHSFPLIEGLVAGGFDVLTLASTRRKAACAKSHTCWASGLITQATYHLPKFRDRLTEIALETYQRFAENHALESRCFWGWSHHHLGAFKKARAAGIPVILETGSTHVHWIRTVLAAENAKHGLKFDQSLIDRLTPRILAEYEIADRICVPNFFAAQTFVHHGIDPKKLAVNPYGVDVDYWSPSERRTPVPAHKFTVIFAGQFMLRKGASYLIDAWRKTRLHDAELWIVGPIVDDARNVLSPLPENLKLLGPKTHAELRAIYRDCDVYSLPSLEEGMARATWEARAAGLPVIVTEETGVGDIVRNGQDGWIVASKSVDSICDALQQAAADRSATSKKGDSARQRVQPYTWKAYGQRAASFLESIIVPGKK